MSRKRSGMTSASIPEGFVANTMPNTGNVEVYEYYQPGLYVIPQILPCPTPLGSAYLAQYSPFEWMPQTNPATYVVSPFGIVNYLSDFEQQFALPTAANIADGLIFQIFNDTDDDGMYMDDGEEEQEEEVCDEILTAVEEMEEDVNEGIPMIAIGQLNILNNMNLTEANVRPCKRQRLSNVENNDPIIEEPDDECNKDDKSNKSGKNIYRAAEGYLVEEPSESDVSGA